MDRQAAPARTLLHPRSRVLAVGSAGVILGAGGAFAVCYSQGLPIDQWWIVLTASVVLVIAAAASAILFSRANITLVNNGVVERGFLGVLHRVDRDRLDHVYIAPVYAGDSQQTTLHLFAISLEGKTLLRMRGQFWAAQDVHAVADHLGVRVETPRWPLTLAELSRARPGLVYWFEQTPRDVVRRLRRSSRPR
jgi:hypothetical protein